ncbi:MAG: SAM-dependent methyltransferase [Planctomycetota bacterium]|jgi:SAM-dependent methyltransferase|uniref:class I SAM-dependent methyltransferase n=1 Tax=Patiriisocius sp. Uisw_047 TaxID=3230969 RepID=UPI0039EC7BD3
MQKETENWYSSWFDSPYYHILYKNRDTEEAVLFMKNLSSYLDLRKNADILDLACGRGRHSKTLHTLGYHVTGVDLSTSNIDFAKQFEEDGLHFFEQDMRVPLAQQFDAVVNLFTSFGYFEDEADNYRTIDAIVKQLKPTGYGVIDFLNVALIKAQLVEKEVKVIDGISFSIHRDLVDGYIVKNISFTAAGIPYSFTEKVKALRLTDFTNYIEQAGAKIKDVFGNYELAPFKEDISERLIIIFKI